MTEPDWKTLAQNVVTWCKELGFSAAGISDTDLGEHKKRLDTWLANGYAGELDYMSRHGDMRSTPADLHAGTQSIISVRMDYLEPSPDPMEILASDTTAYVSRYALGRDYHKVIRGRLKKLSARIASYLDSEGYDGFSSRVFTDSAPTLEKAIGEKAGIGWIGKNTLLMNEKAGSWFFLGEVFTNLPLPASAGGEINRCGSCSACIDVCPTKAIVSPYQLDARLCISYLTIELKGSIPEPLRAPMGNRVFGCDDCQLVCPWNRYAHHNAEADFQPRHGLDDSQLRELFAWTHEEFLKRTEGSAIRRTGYDSWRRNLAVGLGNAHGDKTNIDSLQAGKGQSDLVDEHIDWAIREQSAKLAD